MLSDEIKTVAYEDGKLVILDQTLLPGREEYTELKNAEDVYRAIKRLEVRGAPAIGVAAAYGVLVGINARMAGWDGTVPGFVSLSGEVCEYINSSRPTAVNLSWAVRGMTAARDEALAACSACGPEEAVKAALSAMERKAEAIHREDVESCRAMAEHGLTLLRPGMGLLTHCNAGALATTGYGTALGPIHLGHERGYGFRVFADETRPLLQGARLTAWELSKVGCDVTLICDNMASAVMRSGKIEAVLVGCDRMAANGDGANKIGTGGVAVLAKEYGIPFYMFVPMSTVDFSTPTGDDIVIEERDGDEIRTLWYEKPMAPEGIGTFNPAFDVTPAEYITAV
ncbi:MAG: S-methyl-5-thioribose-1-phosphate isomerase, partial [Eubacterium sp.]|nr:S-methyl-5-thioribose-1-phosphate isomerase [Eubacterium sp.]